MLGHLARLPRLPYLYRKLLRIARWTPLVVLALALRNWPEFVEGPHLWTFLDFGYRGEFRLYLNIELVLSGFALLAVFVHWNASPAWCRLFRPVPRVTAALILATLVLFVVTTFAVNPESIHSEFRPISPVTHIQTWSMSIVALLLGALQQEIWNRAILQSTLARMFGNRWVGLAITVVLLAVEQPGHRVENFCTAIFLGIVFIRTQSVLCTTAIHIVIALSLGILQGGTFMVASFLSPREMQGVKLLVLLGFLLFAFAVELRVRRTPRLIQMTKTAAKSVLWIVLAYALYKVTGKLLHPLWRSLLESNEWMTPRLVTHLALLAQGAVPVIALAWLGLGPRLHELLLPRLKTTLGLAAVAAFVPFLAAFIAVPDAFSDGLFAPLSPFTTSPYFWLGAVLPIFVAALDEEVIHRALVQPLLTRLFRSEWAGVVGSALHFAAFHPPESAVFVIPGGLLFAIVFMRTRSIVCTTVLHVTLNIAINMLSGSQFTLATFIPRDDMPAVRTLFGALVLALAVGFEWCWRMSAGRRDQRVGDPSNDEACSTGSAPTAA
ncbi:CPBP family intramembrane glutamic endopeptidase [Roseateles chitinivorans]|uniref:CPBP family intramembrane glutamic endopeptidase n=1 Tax=Roseateles chitinivorans TaxID=2917965 RepID=UPI003D6658A0